MGHYSIGDGVVVAAVTAGLLGYGYLKSVVRRRRQEIVHVERLAAMEKGIPLPELPIDAPETQRPPDPRVPLIIGIVLAGFGLGLMIAMSMVDEFRRAWPMPLPVAFMGAGLVLYYYLAGRDQSKS